MEGIFAHFRHFLNIYVVSESLIQSQLYYLSGLTYDMSDVWLKI